MIEPWMRLDPAWKLTGCLHHSQDFVKSVSNTPLPEGQFARGDKN
jgi:hypothetical protein